MVQAMICWDLRRIAGTHRERRSSNDLPQSLMAIIDQRQASTPWAKLQAATGAGEGASGADEAELASRRGAGCADRGVQKGQSQIEAGAREEMQSRFHY